MVSTTLNRPMRVVTIGGGHGQSILLKSLLNQNVEISAIVAVSDDGGCSGKLRREMNMPPPGDLRRCLAALVGDGELAEEIERRCDRGPNRGRSVGNQVLATYWEETEDLQKASDLLATQLRCAGRAIPASLEPCTIQATDAKGHQVVGETSIESSGIRPHQLSTIPGPSANPAAIEALHAADVIFLGPGSFYTSVIAPLTVPGIAKAVVDSPARKVMMVNLSPEGNQTVGMTVSDYLQTLQRHLPGEEHSLVDGLVLDSETLDDTCWSLPDSIKLIIGKLRDPAFPAQHSAADTARELDRWFKNPPLEKSNRLHRPTVLNEQPIVLGLRLQTT